MPLTAHEKRLWDRGYASGQKAERNRIRSKRAEDESNIPPRKRWDPVLIDRDPARVFVEWSEKYLRVPDGPLRGKPFLIPKWQERFIRGVMQPEVQEGALSISRKNGKTFLCAAWALCFLAGPFAAHWPEWRGSVVSLDATLAKEFRRAVQKTAEASGYGEEIRVYKTPAPGRIVGQFGNELDILAASEGTGNARGCDVFFIDEAGLLPESMRDIWNACYSSLSGRNGRLIALSIQGDGPMFAEMRARADDTSVHWLEFCSDEDDPIKSRKTWHKANPGLKDGIKSISYMEKACRRALRNPGDESRFRSFDLNQPRDPTRETIVPVELWKKCLTKNPPERIADAYLGIDVGLNTSMTAAAAWWPASGRLEVVAAFPEEPSLVRRGERDGVDRLYVEMERRGELKTWPGLETPLQPFLEWVLEGLADTRIVGISADRFKDKPLKQALRNLGMNIPIKWTSMVWKEAAGDVREFQKAVISGKLKLYPSLLLTQAIRDSALERDKLGNERLDRSRARGKIDALAAAVLAVGAGESHAKPGKEGGKKRLLLGVA